MFGTLERLKRATSLINKACKEIDGIKFVGRDDTSDELKAFNIAVYHFIDAWTPAGPGSAQHQITWVHPTTLSDGGNPYANKNEEAIFELGQSLREIGMINAIEVDPDGVIITGHMRHRAALAAGIPLVPVKVLKDLSVQEKVKRQVAENHTQRKGSNQNVNPMTIVNRMSQDKDGSPPGG